MQRERSLDAVKAFAIIGVLMIHVTAVGFSGFAVGSANWIINTFWGMILRPAVPLFFMVTGCLFLDDKKEISVKKIYTKYILRILVALFVWATAYEAFDILRNEKTIETAIKNLVFFKHHFHLYYLHIILLVYALLPIVRVFVLNSSKKMLEYALVIWVLLGILYPFARPFYPFNQLSGIPTQYAINLTYSGIGFAVLGYYLKKYPFKRFNITTYAIGLLISLGGTIHLSLKYGTPTAVFLEAASPGVLLMAVGLFSFIVKREWKSELWVKLSKASFCIYLVHDFFNILFVKAGFTVHFLSPIISPIIITLASLILSFVVYFVLSKIPIVKKYLI